MISDFDFGHNPYPPLSRSSPAPSHTFSPPASDPSSSPFSNNSSSPPNRPPQPPSSSPPAHLSLPLSNSATSPDLLSIQSQSQSQQSQDAPRSSLSYALPPDAARRVVERYSLDDGTHRYPSPRPSAEAQHPLPSSAPLDSLQHPSRNTRLDPSTTTPSSTTAAIPRVNNNFNNTHSSGRPTPLIPSSPRHPDLPAAASTSPYPTSSNIPPIMPLSASPNYTPPIAPKHRTYPRHPTYITPPAAPNPVNPIYMPSPPQPVEEICIECTMRDRDMADVDVTSPGVWERASDVLYEELKQREREEDAQGIVTADDPSRPRATGGRLTEQNLKLWLSINPREPASRQQTLNSYIKSQRALLEAEATAHAQAMQEAKQLDNQMRDTYSQLRRSAYDTGNTAAPADDSGGVRIKSPTSPKRTSHNRSQSREITLLENGMIVEHVDVRKEEREARERRKKEEMRIRKLSRSSAMDVTSIISAQSYGPLTDSGVGLKPSGYSQSGSTRPISVLTTPPDRPELPRAYSQASFSDVHSLGSASPRRSRFFGIRNLSAGWKSQDSLAPSGMSGSMVDMHVALQRDAYNPRHLTSSPVDSSRRSQLWQPVEVDTTDSLSADKPKKKKKGLAKIWSIVTGAGRSENSHARNTSVSQVKPDDDLPLAPPPPLSYLVSRGPSNMHSVNARHASTPSLPSMGSVRLPPGSPGMSPPTAPSSVLPSPTSSRPSGPDVEIVEPRHLAGIVDDHEPRQNQDDTIGKGQTLHRQPIHSVMSEPDMRQQLSQDPPSSPLPIPIPAGYSNRPPSVMARDKSLPPIPPGETPVAIRPFPSLVDSRPRTVYTYDPRSLPPGSSPADDFLPPQAPFRTGETRRQSFNGLSSRPTLHAVPSTPKLATYDGRRSFGARYDEFGFSRRSLGRVEYVQESVPSLITPTPTKRKSKFGLSSLLGKKHSSRQPDVVNEPYMHQFPSRRLSGSDGQDDTTANGYATSTSRHSALSMGGTTSNVRMSITSRKPLEELVPQDAEFVAYRYPSTDQRLDLLR